MGPFGIGQAVKRFEDPRLVRGGGTVSRRREPARTGSRPRPAVGARARPHPERRRIGGAPGSRRPRGLHGRRPGPGRARLDADDALAHAAGRLAHVRAGAPRPGPRPRAVRGRSRGPPGRRDGRPGRGRGRAGPDRLRAAALGDGDGGGGPARQPAGVGRVPRQRLQRLRGRRPGGGRRRLRAGGSRRPPPLRHHAGPRPVHGAAGRARASTTPARTATRSTPTSSTRTACATCWRRASSGFPSTGSGSSRGTSAVPSGPRAGSIPSTGWCCGRRGSWGGRSSGRASGARRSWPTSTPGTP